MRVSTESTLEGMHFEGVIQGIVFSHAMLMREGHGSNLPPTQLHTYLEQAMEHVLDLGIQDRIIEFDGDILCIMAKRPNANANDYIKLDWRNGKKLEAGSFKQHF